VVEVWVCCSTDRVPDSSASSCVVLHRMSVQVYSLTKSLPSSVSKDVNVSVTPVDPVGATIQVQLESF
jgi:hypothetical protein